MAVSNSIGSNVFDILIGLVCVCAKLSNASGLTVSHLVQPGAALVRRNGDRRARLGVEHQQPRSDLRRRIALSLAAHHHLPVPSAPVDTEPTSRLLSPRNLCRLSGDQFGARIPAQPTDLRRIVQTHVHSFRTHFHPYRFQPSRLVSHRCISFL